ncbi:YfbU family protein [Rhizobium sp. KVB221]|uniref:YfbU family protein n=1 Tax=Rhizobium setariae TaxID=2801340 RepID=A0A936YVK3_9HYPH|nr:YfbU family protein [Rhizobium setariae]MBL0374551.1 YfbU family protein [Rhizobium setariae]
MDRPTRLILWNQLELLKTHNPGNVAELQAQQEILASGDTSRYSELFHMFSDEEASAEMQKEVYDVLEMFRALGSAKQNGWTPSNEKASKFEGFDANNDPHFAFAQYLIDRCRLYPESAPNRNSHSISTLSSYRRMLRIWRKAGNKYELSEAEAEAIIHA